MHFEYAIHCFEVLTVLKELRAVERALLCNADHVKRIELINLMTELFPAMYGLLRIDTSVMETKHI